MPCRREISSDAPLWHGTLCKPTAVHSAHEGTLEYFDAQEPCDLRDAQYGDETSRDGTRSPRCLPTFSCGLVSSKLVPGKGHAGMKRNEANTDNDIRDANCMPCFEGEPWSLRRWTIYTYTL